MSTDSNQEKTTRSHCRCSKHTQEHMLNTFWVVILELCALKYPKNYLSDSSLVYFSLVSEWNVRQKGRWFLCLVWCEWVSDVNQKKWHWDTGVCEWFWSAAGQSRGQHGHQQRRQQRRSGLSSLYVRQWEHFQEGDFSGWAHGRHKSTNTFWFWVAVQNPTHGRGGGLEMSGWASEQEHV